LSNVGWEPIERLKAGTWCWLRCVPVFHLASLFFDLRLLSNE
jgi:hypothetical protein